MTLGIGTYRVLVNERGAGRFVGELTPYLTGGSYDRVRNGIPVANLTLTWPKGPGGARCRDLVRQIEPWAHELSITRDGVEVWVGPVSRRPIVSGNDGMLTAFGMLAWLDVRFARTSRDYSVSGVAASTFITNIINDAISLDDPGFLVEVRSMPDLVYRAVIGSDDEYAWSGVLEPMLGSVMDVTTVGRLVVFWEHGTEVGTVRQALTNQDLQGDWPLEQTGEFFASRVAFHGKDTLRSVSGGTSARYGLVERRMEDDRVVGQNEADLLAARSVTTIPPLTILGDSSNGTLSCDCPLSMSDLVPGAYIRCTLIGDGEIVDRMLRLEQVAVQITPQNDPVESVGVAFMDPSAMENAE